MELGKFDGRYDSEYSGSDFVKMSRIIATRVHFS